MEDVDAEHLQYNKDTDAIEHLDEMVDSEAICCLGPI